MTSLELQMEKLILERNHFQKLYIEYKGALKLAGTKLNKIIDTREDCPLTSTDDEFKELLRVIDEG